MGEGYEMSAVSMTDDSFKVCACNHLIQYINTVIDLYIKLPQAGIAGIVGGGKAIPEVCQL